MIDDFSAAPFEEIRESEPSPSSGSVEVRLGDAVLTSSWRRVAMATECHSRYGAPSDLGTYG